MFTNSEERTKIFNAHPRFPRSFFPNFQLYCISELELRNENWRGGTMSEQQNRMEYFALSVSVFIFYFNLENL